MQSDDDALASLFIGDYMRQHMPHSTLEVIAAKGHCLHMTHPELVAKRMHAFFYTCLTTRQL